MLKRLYQWTMSLAARPRAELWLAVVAFVESSFFLIPADVLFVPMALARPQRAYRLAFVATLFSVLGGILGYAIGYYAFEALAKPVLAFYFIGMLVTIALAFGWAFYLTAGLVPFLVLLFFMGFAGGNFTMFSLWLPEQYETEVRATAFAFTTSVGRFIGAGVNFLLGAMVKSMGTLGTPVALTAIAFGIGLLIIPFGIETVGRRLPD